MKTSAPGLDHVFERALDLPISTGPPRIGRAALILSGSLDRAELDVPPESTAGAGNPILGRIRMLAWRKQ
jgi:hypothetical protein